MLTFLRPFVLVTVFAISLLANDFAFSITGVFQEGSRFGVSGAIDGTTALVGQRFGGDDGNGDVFVYDVGGAGWALSANLADLLPDNALATGADFGAKTLAIDGDTAMAAAYRNTVDGKTQAGNVFLFSRIAGEWSYADQWSEPLAPGATTPTANAFFGAAGDLDGDQALVVAGGTNAAYIYSRTEGIWDSGTLLAGGNLNSPATAALDNGVAVVGSFTGTGHLDVWRCSEGLWGHEATISNPGSDNLFATDVDISGNTIVVSAYSQDVGEVADAGAVYVYHYDGGQWALQQTIEQPEATEGDAFGYSVALAGDQLVVGAPRRDLTVGEEVRNDVGTAYLFERTGTLWELVDQSVLLDGDAGQWFGETVAIDSTSMLIGGSGKTTDPVGEGIAILQLNTIPGDANGDERVDAADVSIMAANWGATDATWGMGDFNEDGSVNEADAKILASNWGTSVGGGESVTAAVPEPSAMFLLLSALSLILARSFQRRPQ